MRDRETGTEAERERNKETGGGRGPPFKREHVQEVPLVTAAEDASCQDLNGRPVQMPKYKQ